MHLIGRDLWNFAFSYDNLPSKFSSVFWSLLGLGCANLYDILLKIWNHLCLTNMLPSFHLLFRGFHYRTRICIIWSIKGRRDWSWLYILKYHTTINHKEIIVSIIKRSSWSYGGNRGQKRSSLSTISVAPPRPKKLTHKLDGFWGSGHWKII